MSDGIGVNMITPAAVRPELRVRLIVGQRVVWFGRLSPAGFSSQTVKRGDVFALNDPFLHQVRLLLRPAVLLAAICAAH